MAFPATGVRLYTDLFRREQERRVRVLAVWKGVA